MKSKYLLLAIVAVIAYYCRSFLPMMFFGGDGIEVEINVPANLVPTATASYESSDCQTITFSDGSWINQKGGHRYNMEKISDTSYRTKIYYRDFSPCSWKIRSLGWTLHYKDADSIVSGLTDGGSGGGMSIHIINGSFLTKSELDSPYYHDDERLVLNGDLEAKVLKDRLYKDKASLYIDYKKKSTQTTYFNPYKHRETAKIIYNVTVDESKVMGLTVEQVLANQEKERAEAQEQ